MEPETARASEPARPFLVCQGCIGKHLALRAIQEGGPALDQPVVTVTVAPGRAAGQTRPAWNWPGALSHLGVS